MTQDISWETQTREKTQQIILENIFPYEDSTAMNHALDLTQIYTTCKPKYKETLTWINPKLNKYKMPSQG